MDSYEKAPHQTTLKKNETELNSDMSRETALKYAEEIIDLVRAKHPNITISLNITLEEKQNFGDLDFIVTSPASKEEDNNQIIEALDNRLKKHTRVPKDTVDHCLIEMDDGQVIPADFIRATDQEDFETKLIYYSKGHLSAALGTLAKSLGFLYGKDGFFYRYTDSRGQHHKLPITKNLKEGMEIMGLDSSEWENLKTEDDLIKFVISSPYYSPDLLSKPSTKRRRYLEKKRNQKQKIFYTKLNMASSYSSRAKKTSKECVQNCLEKFQLDYPDLYRNIQNEIAQKEVDLSNRKTGSFR